MIKRSLIALVAAATLAMPAFAEEVTIHGSTTVDSNLFQPYKAKLEKETGLTFTVVANGSSRGIEGIDSGAANIGMISSGLDGVLRKLNLSDRAGEFHSEQVGEERITYSVHPSNPVTSISKDQVIGVLNGSIKNWSELGGKDAPIVVVTEYSGGGFRTTVEKKLLDKKPISPASLKDFPNGPQAVKVGSQIPTALVVAPSNMIKGSPLKKLESDAEIVQPLNFVVKGEQTEAFKKLVAAAKTILSH